MSSGANKSITKLLETRSLHFTRIICINSCSITASRYKGTIVYLAERGRPPREMIIGSDKADNASLIPFASAIALPHKIRDERSVSAAINPISPLIPRDSPILELNNENDKINNIKNSANSSNGLKLYINQYRFSIYYLD